VGNQSEKMDLHRLTKDGRRLWYFFRIIQQPSIGRAAGSGPSAVADRRPIDPPPVLQLRIFEGDNMDYVQDITPMYLAQFFAYASIEGVQQGGRLLIAKKTAAILGTTVAGSSFLNQPEPAYYFVFDDLSVQFEGQYFLKFDLYEQQMLDMDRDALLGESDHVDIESNNYFSHRQSISSAAFSVVPPKRFKGFTYSTGLSWVLAEQGIRIRIRSDLRAMRKAGSQAGSTRISGRHRLVENRSVVHHLTTISSVTNRGTSIC
ncbi:velvet factor-domain-containing protein, partial [Microdochium trichocladiopsis]